MPPSANRRSDGRHGYCETGSWGQVGVVVSWMGHGAQMGVAPGTRRLAMTLALALRRRAFQTLQEATHCKDADECARLARIARQLQTLAEREYASALETLEMAR